MPARPPKDGFVSVTTAAEILEVSPDTLYNLEKKGKITPKRDTDGKRIYSQIDIDFLEFYLSKPQLFSLEDTARILGVSKTTLRRWDKANKIESTRTPGGHRRFSKKQIESAKLKRYQSIPVDSFSLQPGKKVIPQLYQTLHLSQKKALAFALSSLLIAAIGFAGFKIPKLRNKVEHTISYLINLPKKDIQIAEELEQLDLRVLGLSLDTQRFLVNVDSTFRENVVLDKKFSGWWRHCTLG